MLIQRTLLIALTVTGCTDVPEDDLGEATQALAPVVTLRALWNPTTGDNALTTNPAWAPAGYTSYRTEGRIFSPTSPPPPDTLPLWTWYGAARGDYMTTTNPYWDPAGGSVRNNYTYVRLEGYVHALPVAGTHPLQMWWSPSRGDNWTSSDPRLTSDTSQISSPDYDFVRPDGFILPATTPQSPMLKENFRWGDLNGTPGARDLLVLRERWRDVASVFTAAQLDSLVFGPGYPNLRDYVAALSQNRFNWRRGAIIGEYTYPDDPTTNGDESSYHVAVPDGTSTRMVFVTLRGASGDRIAATAPSTVVTGGGADCFETFQIHDQNGGDLLSGDRVALKSCDGGWLRESGGVVTADAASPVYFTIFGAAAPITTETTVSLQAASGRYLYEDVAAGRVRATTSSTPSRVFELAKSGPDVERSARMMIALAAASGYNFRTHDKDGNGMIDADELSLVLMVATPSNRGGASRSMRAMVIPNTSPALLMGPRLVSSMGDRMSFMTLAHEMLHHFVGYEMYPGNSSLSTMAATIFGNVDDRRTFMLDPMTRVRLGWVEPDIQAFEATGASGLQYTPDATGVRPLLIYDPRKYDTAAKSGEYFYVEFRNRDRSGYDADTSGRGVAVWRVTTNRANTFAASGTGGSTLWTATDGTITPTYADGTPSAFRLEVGASTTTSAAVAVEWSNNGTLRPRLDGGSAVLRPGQIAQLDGMLPVSAVDLTARIVDDTGTSTPLTFWNTPTQSLAYVNLPASLAEGRYLIYLKNGTRESNGHPIEILPPL